MRAARSVFIAALALVGTSACDTGDGRSLDPPTMPLPPPPPPPTTVPVETVAPVDLPMSMFAPWPSGAAIPDRHTCSGEGISPALSWSEVPLEATELVLTLTDLDEGVATLWVIDGIFPTTVGMGEGSIPAEAFERANASGQTGYEAPCPPTNEPHTFQFTLHALNQQLEVADDATADEIISFLNQTAIEQSSVSGIVTRTE